MKKSHRKGMSLIDEYGSDVASEIKKKYSDAALSRTYTEHEYTCSGCNILFVSNVQIISKNKYHSKECQLLHTNLKKVNCDNCGSELIKRNYDTKKYFFCTRMCYHSWMKSTGIKPPQNELRKQNANSKNAIEKRRKTNIKLGIWHDPLIHVNGLDKKQYGKLVRFLTKSMRKELLNIWDGYDYYTKEYIKDNFKLHWSHGDYPSIDHKISITEGMRLGMTVAELCDISNLVYTKKRVNSMKRALPESEFWKKIKTYNEY
jgi:hypothetical protein